MSANANPLLDGQLSLTVGGVEYIDKPISDLQCEDVAPGGDASLSFRLWVSNPFTVATDYPTLIVDAYVELKHGSTQLFAGYVCNDPTVGYAGEQAYVDVECHGLFARAKARQDYIDYWTCRDTSTWTLHRRSAKSAQLSTDGEVRLEIPQNVAIDSSDSCGAYYSILGALRDDRPIGWLEFDWEANLGNATDAQWRARLAWPANGMYSDSWSFGYNPATYPWVVNNDWVIQGVSGGGVQTGHAAVVAPNLGTSSNPVIPRTVMLRLVPVTETVTAKKRYVRLYNLSIIRGKRSLQIISISAADPTVVTTATAHGLTDGDQVVIGGTDSTPLLVGYYTVTVIDSTRFYIPAAVTTAGTTGRAVVVGSLTIDGVMSEIATGLGATSCVTESIPAAGDALLDLHFDEPTTQADILAAVAGLSTGRADWRFRGLQFIAKPRPTSPTSYYVVDATQPGISVDVRTDPEATPDYVRVLYACRGDASWPDGTVRSVIKPSDPGWSGAPALRARITTLDYTDRLLSASEAESIATQALAWYSAGDPTGTITIAVPTVKDQAGNDVVAAYIRAGDFIDVVNYPNHRPWYITGRTVDITSGVVTLSIGGSGDQFVPRLEPAHPSSARRPAQKRHRRRKS